MCDAFLSKHVKPGNVVVLLARSLEAQPVMERLVAAPRMEKIPVATLLELLIAGLISFSLEAGVTDEEFERWVAHAAETYRAVLTSKAVQH